jgi:putative CocE/NonD family hydrolase
MAGFSFGKSRLTRRALAKLTLAASASLAFRQSRAEAGGDMALLSGVMVPMRDGIRLATDIYIPAKAGKPLKGPFPVILERTPYGRNIVSRSELSVDEPIAKSRADVAHHFVAHGYVVIYQDCRGRFGSEGAFVKYLSDGNDGYDCCDWITRQDWCNGKIGTMGLSYAAHTQGALGCANPPGLAAMFLDSGGFSNAYQGGIRQGGAFELKQVTWAYRAAFESPEVKNDPARLAALKAIDIKAWFAHMPWKRGQSPLTPAPDYENYIYDQWEHGVFDSYWQQLGIYAEGFYDNFKDVPMLHMSSWYDPYPRTATDNFRGLSARKKGPVRLILGPWTHGDRSRSYAGDVDFGPQATLDHNLAPDYLTLRLRWFDRWLKGVETADSDKPVRLFVMGGGSGRKNAAGRLEHGGNWFSADNWPLPETVYTPFYCHTARRLAQKIQNPGEAPLSYDFDPAHPVPSIGGSITSGEPIMTGGAFDQRENARIFGATAPYRPLSERADVLSFETETLEADLAVIGPIKAVLFVSSNRPDTDFTIKLIDFHPPNSDYPEGFAMNLTDGILRCRYRNHWDHPEPMVPGEIVQIVVEAFPTANLFKAGHKIRLDISSSNFPHFDVNPNNFGPEGSGEGAQIATNQLYLDRDHPSHILLPIIPTKALKPQE